MEDEINSAQRALYIVECKRRALENKIDDLVEAARAEIAKTMEPERMVIEQEIIEAKKEVNRLVDLRDEQLVAKSMLDPRLGKLYLQWKMDWTHNWVRTKKSGTVSVLTKELNLSLNRIGFGSVNVGGLIIWHLKADGSFSKQYSAINCWGWFEDGKNPNK